MIHQTPPTQILGKRIKAAIAATSYDSNPQEQLFLIFDDDTYLELFGSEFEFASSLQPGGERAVMHYLRDRKGEIFRIGD